MMSIIRTVLWVDCTAAAAAGVTVLCLSEWLSRLHGLPQELLLFLGAVNIAYASYSFSLAARETRPIFLIKLLVVANASWAIVCLGLALLFHDEATAFGLSHLIGEAFFVGALAMLEWNQRDKLVRRVDRADDIVSPLNTQLWKTRSRPQPLDR